MPRHLAPNRSGVHRLACLSLYHVLLSQCSRTFIGSHKADEIRELIRTRFHKDKTLQSITKIANALKAGHEALNLFQLYAKGDKNSIQRVDSLLAATRSLSQKILEERRAQAIRTPAPDPTSPAARARANRRPEALRPHPDREPILSRPRPVVSGRRRVPVLVNARGIPFLRIKKPQPPNLSHTIRGLLNTRWKRIERRERLELELIMARDEDFWDGLTGQNDASSWAVSVKDSLDDVNKTILEGDRANRDMAQKMWEVVLKERELAKKEALERKQKLDEKAKED
ncbi:hypothetical protein PRK78_006186 [Emydomyces testavorans]|uniref:Complex 1 LYR protein domain-containing protein n=1 Tax=Emydomyces testavorans TaxID=2070801 RepID=A0AAF0DKX8_9EURO|nr:hypothetical protein PRK78_006186 [Emydomyces testavorans]